MSDDHDLPEADRAPGAPHPRETPELFGQSEAEAQFMEAVTSGRLHHGWLISGPKGIGKATLAWKLARFLIATPPASDDDLFGAPPPPTSLDIAPDHPVARRVAALSEPALFLLRRAWDPDKKRLKQVITIDEARKLKGFFQLSAPDGGRRVVIIDAADEMNSSAANAILKILEEPPADTIMLLIAHQPSRLLPTIRSRCRMLRAQPLGAEDMRRALHGAGQELGDEATQVAELAQGSVGQAIRIVELGGLAAYQGLIDHLGRAPNMDRAALMGLADKAAARTTPELFDLTVDLIDLMLSRLARSAVSGPPAEEAAKGEVAAMQRLAPTPHAARKWAGLQQELGARARQGKAVNLDPSSLILDMMLRINQTAAELAA